MSLRIYIHIYVGAISVTGFDCIAVGSRTTEDGPDRGCTGELAAVVHVGGQGGRRIRGTRKPYGTHTMLAQTCEIGCMHL
jgi:hypothetical protein